MVSAPTAPEISMTPILQASQQRLFGAADGVCLERARLVTEAWRRGENDPTPVKRAQALAHVLRRMTLDADTNPVFAGAMSSGPRRWMLIPEHGFQVMGQVEIEHDDLRGFLDDKIPEDLRAFWAGRSGPGGMGHLAVDQDIVVNRGLRSVIDELAAYDDDRDARRRGYRRAMRIALEAVIDWSHRWADRAAQRAEAERDPAAAAYHRRVAEACRRVPEHPARDLFEGLQAMALVHSAIHLEGHHMSVSVGLPDRALARFADEAAADPNRAADLCAAFALKLAENAYTGKGSLTQCITIGGADHRGADQTNAVTHAFLESFDRVAVSDPHLFLRWHENLAPAVKAKAAAMLARGRSMPLLVNDEPTAGGLLDAGVAPADAWGYCVIGCNELGVPGRLFDSAVPIGCSFNDLSLLNQLLMDDQDGGCLASMEALAAALEERYAAHLEPLLRRRPETKQRIAETFPTPFTSALMIDGPRRGCDLMAGMPYDIPCCYTRGLANAANALAAIERVVFEDRAMTPAALIDALRDDLADPAAADRLAAAPKWGNDDDRADRWALTLTAMRDRALDRLAAAGLPRPVVCHVVRSLHHVDGRRLAASPDGRRAGEPVGDSLGGVCGTMKEGPTATLASVLKLDARRQFAGGTNLNLTLHAGQADPVILSALIEGFFDGGGQELQVAVLHADTLHAARACPQRFADLVVRIAGLNARFIELSAAEQDELIRRAEEAEAGAPA